MSSQVFIAGVLREWWDDASRTYRSFDEQGAQMSTRPYTAAENQLADESAQRELRDANERTLREKAGQAIAFNDAFLALATPSNAQVVAQVQRLTREATALIRLTIRALDSTDGTF